MKRRTFSKEKKLAILKEAEKAGVKATLDKHGLYPATFYDWKSKYSEMGESGFRHGMTRERLKEIRRLEKENADLKEIMADKDLKIKMQQEIIKKNLPVWAKKGKS